jgi:hypothetical protein
MILNRKYYKIIFRIEQIHLQYKPIIFLIGEKVIYITKILVILKIHNWIIGIKKNNIYQKEFKILMKDYLN